MQRVAIWHWYLLLCICIASVHPFFILFLKSGIDKLTEWSTIPACPSLMCFFNKGDTEGTSLMFAFDVCVCFVLCKLCQD